MEDQTRRRAVKRMAPRHMIVGIALCSLLLAGFALWYIDPGGPHGEPEVLVRRIDNAEATSVDVKGNLDPAELAAEAPELHSLIEEAINNGRATSAKESVWDQAAAQLGTDEHDNIFFGHYRYGNVLIRISGSVP